MSSQTATTLHLSTILQEYIWYSNIFITSFGLVGNLFNFLIFISLKTFQTNHQTFYLRTEAVMNSMFLIFAYVDRYLISAYGYNISRTSLAWCKLRACLGQSGRLLASVLVCFLAFDQFLVTNHQYRVRRLSSMTLACLFLVVSTILCFGHGIMFGMYLDFDSKLSCVITSSELIHYYAYFYYPVLHGFLPISLSALFSLLAYRNVRRLVRLQLSLNRRRLDRQLTAMIFARVICFIILHLPYTIYRIYVLTLEVTVKSSSYQYVINQFIENVTLSWLSLHYGISFYLFLATSTRYRRQLKEFLLKICWKHMKQCRVNHPNRVIPSTVESNISVSE